jgi:general secretion pathway protein A
MRGQMYLSFYRLKHKPFQISTDPKFLWLGEKHEEALATLRYGVLDNKGFLLLTGDVGTGKTTLINALLKILGRETIVATVRDPDLEPMDFFHYISHAFGMSGNFTSKGTFLIEFEQFLHEAHRTQKRVLLIIDEAQRINQKLLEEIRLLSNIEKEEKKLLNIFFVGQIEFNEILLRQENRPIRQRITVNYNIEPLSRNESDVYIRHRLKIAGTEDEIFEEGALAKIYIFSQGYPRLINIICDRCLLTGFVSEEKIISAAHVDECIAELSIPRFTHHKPTLPEPLVSAATPTPADTVTQTSDDHPAISFSRVNKKEKSSSHGNLLLIIIFIIIILASSSSFYILFPEKYSLIKDYAFSLYNTKLEEHDISTNNTKNIHAVPNADNNINYATNQDKKNNIELKQNSNQQSTSLDKTISVVSTTIDTDQGNKDNLLPDKSLSKNETSQKILNNVDNGIDSTNKDIVNDQLNNISLNEIKKITIQFPSDSNFPAGNAINELDNLIVFLAKNKNYNLIVNGYSDSYGNEVYNKKLSEFRAYSVKSYLIGKGLDETRILAQGFGSQNPVATNDTSDGRIANRRVEIELQPKGLQPSPQSRQNVPVP